jgi:hypothetical protein
MIDGHEIMHQVTYAVTFEDFRAVIRVVDMVYPGIPGAPAPKWLVRTVRILKWLLSEAALWIVIFELVLLSMIDGPIRMWHVAIVFITSFIAGAGALWSLQDKTPLKVIKGYVEGGRTPTMRLTEAGVETERGKTASFTPWSAYWRVEISDKFVFLFHEGVADFIPVSAFPDDDSVREFAKFAAAKVAENGEAARTRYETN